ARIIADVDGQLTPPRTGPITIQIQRQDAVDLELTQKEWGRTVVLIISAQWASQAGQAGRGSHLRVDEDGAIVRTQGTREADILPYALQSPFVDRPAGAAHRVTGASFSSAHREALTAIKLSPWYDELFSYL